LIHHAEKPEKYISNLVNCGVYLFNAGFKKSILYAKEKKETSLSDELVHKPYVKFIKRSTDLNAKYLSLENDVFK
jgi:mannose-1-phosphate guanylyltransferase